MKINLNLATKPFGRSRLFWTASAIGGAALVLIAVSLVAAFVQNREPPPEIQAAEARSTAEIRRLSSEEAKLRGELRDDDTINTIDRSHFLNQLLARKGISWTQTFSDLEKVLPPRVLMTQIRPEVTFDNRVMLEMQVGAETPNDFIEFLVALEGSEVFGSPDVRGRVPPNENDPYYRFELTVRYEQEL